jgi:hypothetical protein
MIIGAHSIIYSANPDADRAFLRDLLTLPSVDVGGGWLIFGLPPAEVAVHPSEKNGVHELYLMCDDVEAFIADMQSKQIACSAIANQGWGLLTHLTLPGGGKLGVYQPRHARPESVKEARAARKKPATPRRNMTLAKAKVAARGKAKASASPKKSATQPKKKPKRRRG